MTVNEAPTTGPMPPPRSPAPYNFSSFDVLMGSLQDWRSEDHADTITMNRNQVIEIIEGAKALRAALAEIAAMDPKGIRADDLGRAARLAAAVFRC